MSTYNPGRQTARQRKEQTYRPLLPLISRRRIAGRQQQHCKSKGVFK